MSEIILTGILAVRIVTFLSFMICATFLYLFNKGYYKKLNIPWVMLSLGLVVSSLLQLPYIILGIQMVIDIITAIILIASGIFVMIHAMNMFKDKLIPKNWIILSLTFIGIGIFQIFFIFIPNIQLAISALMLLFAMLIALVIFIECTREIWREWGMERVKTGVYALDELMHGGIPPGSTVLVIGPPGIGKTTLAEQFIADGLIRGQPCLYISIDEYPKDVRDRIKRFEANDKGLIIIDAVSWKHNKKSKEKWVIESEPDLDKLSITLTKALESIKATGNKKAVFDAFSSVALFSQPDMVLKFFQNSVNKLRAADFTSLIIIEAGALEEKTLSTLKYLADGIIQIKKEGSKAYINIEKMKGTSFNHEWWEFNIGRSGASIGKKFEEEIEI